MERLRRKQKRAHTLNCTLCTHVHAMRMPQESMQHTMRLREETLKKIENGLLSREARLKRLEDDFSVRTALLSQAAEAKLAEAQVREKARRDEDAARILLHEQLERKRGELELQELRINEKMMKMSETELHLQDMLQVRKLEVNSSVTSSLRHELAVVEEQARSEEPRKKPSNRMRAETADNGNKKAARQEDEVPDESAIDWLQSLEFETARQIDRLAERQSALKSLTNKDEECWISETSELLTMWLQTGKMIREHIKSRRRKSGSVQENVVRKDVDRDNDVAKSPWTNSMSPIMAISPSRSVGNRPVDLHAVRVQVHEANAPEVVLSEQCQQLGALLRHRNAQTALLIREITAVKNLKDFTGSYSAMISTSAQKEPTDAGSSVAEQLAYELDSVSRERSELEEVLAEKTVSDVLIISSNC